MKVAMWVVLKEDEIRNVSIDRWGQILSVPIEDWTDVFVAVAANWMLNGDFTQYVVADKFDITE